mmetsp:Transcript_26511/g.67845  ORF Transcript_26511/g.67845 Transcript_26511/m.67845 type:complete len:124 (-) Transcript_26511:2328-2699(-)
MFLLPSSFFQGCTSECLATHPCSAFPSVEKARKTDGSSKTYKKEGKIGNQTKTCPSPKRERGCLLMGETRTPKTLGSKEGREGGGKGEKAKHSFQGTPTTTIQTRKEGTLEATRGVFWTVQND